jgi:hypothetical protein
MLSSFDAKRTALGAAALLLSGCAASLHLVNPRTGEAPPRVLWTREAGAPSALTSHNQVYSPNGPPVVTAAGNVLVPCKNALVAFSPSGQRLWDFTEGIDFQTPAIDADGRSLLSWRGGLALLDPNGKKLWSKNVPVVDALLDGHGGAYLLEQRSLSAVDASGAQLWKVAAHGSNEHVLLALLPAGPALAWSVEGGGRVQQFDTRGRSLGEVVLKDADTPLSISADRVLWTGGRSHDLYTFNGAGKELEPRIELGSRGAPVAIDDQGMIYTDEGNTIGPDGTARWKFSPDWPDSLSTHGKTWCCALGAGGAIYASGVLARGGVSPFDGRDSYVYAVRGDGSERWAMFFGNDGVSLDTYTVQIALAPQLAVGPEGTLYVVSDGKLSALDTGIHGKPPVAWATNLRAGRSPLAAGLGGNTSESLPIAAAPAPSNEVAGVTASSGARFDVKKGAKVAVLNFTLRASGVEQSDALFLSDVVRGSLLSAMPGVDVIDRDNLLVLMQASGKSLAECEGECEVETGRRIGAELVISGELLRFAGQLKLSLRLHETGSGKLLASVVVTGDALSQLEQRARGAAASLAESIHVGP